MGMFAGAVFIRNQEQLTKETLIEKFNAYMHSKGFVPCDKEQGKFNFTFAFSGKWFSVVGKEERLSFNTGYVQSAFGLPMFTADLVDSDFVELILYDADGNQKDFECIGEPYWEDEDIEEYEEEYGIKISKPKNNLSAWSAYLKEGVSLDDLQTAVDAHEVFAEDAFGDFCKLIEVDVKTLFFDGISDFEEIRTENENITELYFKKA
ncbi:MAG: hypothetical protein V3G42_01390 [Oscillospiraceae bacterium]